MNQSVSQILILDSLFFLPLDPGSGMGKKSGSVSGSGMNNPDHISKSSETIRYFGLKYLNSFLRIRDPGRKTIRIRDERNSDPG
jgi:hypothetical protein